jgi:hypothetical protein
VNIFQIAPRKRSRNRQRNAQSRIGGFSARPGGAILKATEDAMPLPHFLILILAVILAAGLTIWAASAIGIPLFALGFLALLAAAIAHLTTRDHRS